VFSVVSNLIGAQVADAVCAPGLYQLSGEYAFYTTVAQCFGFLALLTCMVMQNIEPASSYHLTHSKYRKNILEGVALLAQAA
jgi:hypothetical protein